MGLIRYLFRLPTKLRRKARRSRMALVVLLFSLFFLLVAPFYVIYKPPHALINHFQRRWPDVLWQVPTTKKIVALTIDDAPSRYTRKIGRLLKANDATATFFVIGRQAEGEFAEIDLEDLVTAGNELGNHAMRDEASRSLSDDMLKEQIQQVHEKIEQVYRYAEATRPNLYFRPGSGFFSQRMLKTVAGLGYRMVLGSIYPHDPQIAFPRINAAHILSMLRPGAIIICHDRRSWTLPMLERIIPEIKRRGYEIVTVTRLLEEANAQ